MITLVLIRRTTERSRRRPGRRRRPSRDMRRSPWHSRIEREPEPGSRRKYWCRSQGLGVHRFNGGRRLPVPQLANVEVSVVSIRQVDSLPSEEDVARGLHEPLSLNDPLPMVLDAAAGGEAFQHRLPRLFHLKEENIIRILPDKERDPTTSADATDTDDLSGQCDISILVQQMPAIGHERCPIGAERALGSLLPTAVPPPARCRHLPRGREAEDHSKTGARFRQFWSTCPWLVTGPSIPPW